MIRSLIPWRVLIRNGVPPLKVARRDLALGEVIVPVGETLDPELLPMQIRTQRLRQFYEQHRLEPVNPPQTSRQYYAERMLRLQGQEVPIEPVQPVASQIVADLPGFDVPPAPRKTKGAR